MDLPASIVLGTWPLGGRAYGPIPLLQARQILVGAGVMQVPWLDTADIYGDGAVEALIGEVFRGAPVPRIVTKLGYKEERSET